MSSSVEIILPVRNPTVELRKTIDSLVAQATRDFSVLLSDNWSTNGQQYINEADAILRQAGLTVRLVRPPVELGRVEHWNWSHSEARSEWIKPLFTGDWLSAEYLRETQAAIDAHPNIDIVNCSFAQDGQVQTETHFQGGFRGPAQVLNDAFREGNCLGGPINICFRRLAFTCAGGYPPSLPVSADFWLILTLALKNGLFTCAPILAYFNAHPDRFSSAFPFHRIDGPREHFVILLAASSQAAFAEIPFDKRRRNRYFWRLAKMSLKSWLNKRGLVRGKAAS